MYHNADLQALLRELTAAADSDEVLAVVNRSTAKTAQINEVLIRVCL